MRKRFAIAIVLLVLTCATAIVVWGASQSRLAGQHGARHNSTTTAGWPRPVPESWPAEPKWIQTWSTPWSTVHCAFVRDDGSGFLPRQVANSYGWPLRLCEMAVTLDEKGCTICSHSYGAWPSPPWLARCLGQEPTTHVAIHPLWFGLVVDLLVYLGFWSAVLVLIGLARRSLHKRRLAAGNCRSCGYDRAGIGAVAVCPECGTAPRS
jgi:hypothetical protein